MWSRCSWSHILGMACLPLSKTCWEWQASCEALRARSPACTFPLVEVLQLETLTMMVWILEPKLKSWTRIEPELSLIQLDCHSLKEWQKDQASCWILHKCKFLRRLCAIFSLREVAWMAWKDKRKEVERCSLPEGIQVYFLQRWHRLFPHFEAHGGGLQGLLESRRWIHHTFRVILVFSLLKLEQSWGYSGVSTQFPCTALCPRNLGSSWRLWLWQTLKKHRQIVFSAS